MAGICDGHVHLFPDAEMGRDWLRTTGVAEPKRDGTLVEYKRLMAGTPLDGITVLLHARAQTLLPDGDRTVDHPAVLERVRSYNDWGLRVLAPVPPIAVAVGVDPSLMSEGELRREIARGAEAGAAAVKFALASARAYLDAPGCLVVFEEATRLGLPVVVQSGHNGPVGERGHPFGRPAYLSVALAALPGLRVVLAHFGEGYDEEMVDLANRFEGVHGDLSMRLTKSADVESLARLVRRFDPARVLFGSNYPIADPSWAAARLPELGLDFSDTWHRLFGRAVAHA